MRVDVQYWDSNIISYTSVQNNSQGVGIVKSIDSDIVEIMYMILNIMSLGMKEELVWVGIYKSLFQRKLSIERKKSREEFVILIIYIN